MNAKLNLCHCNNSEVSFMGCFFVMYWAAIVDLCECQDDWVILQRSLCQLWIFVDF